MFHFPAVRKFTSGIFQDVDGEPSAKRTGFFIFIALIVICVFAGVFWKIAIPEMIWNGLVELIKWIGTAILGERAPACLAALNTAVRGNGPLNVNIVPDVTKVEEAKAKVVP